MNDSYERYRKSRNNIRAVIIGAVCGSVFLAIYFVMDPTDLSSFEQITLATANVQIVETSRKDRLSLKVGDTKYEIPYKLWQGRFSRDELVSLVEQSGNIKLWVQSLDTKFVKAQGVQTKGLFIDPELGVEMDNSNRNALLWLVALFFGLGAAAGVTEVFQRWKDGRLFKK